MSRILIADDHALFRRGVSLILKQSGDDLVIGEAGDAGEIMRSLEQASWDLLILDLELPGRSGMDLLREVHRRFPMLPVMILTGFSEDDFALRALQDGAMGYLTKGCEAQELVVAVHKVLAGGRHITGTLADKLAASLSQRTPRQPSNPDMELTGRILEVVRLIGKGQTVKEIAAELHLSIKTVSTYRTRALQQLNLHSTAELVRYCMHRGLVK